MIKSTNHMASPSLLIKCVRLLACSQLEKLQEQQGQEQTGGLFFFGFFFVCVFSWLRYTGALSRLLHSQLWIRQKKKTGVLSIPVSMINVFSLLFRVIKLIATFDVSEGFGFPVVALMQGCVHRIRMLCHSASGCFFCFFVYMNRKFEI